MDLNGKVAVVTGSGGGIGLGIARACAAEGMRVVLSDVDADRTAAAADELRASGAEVAHFPCDVRDRARVDDLRDAALQRFDRVDLVCNNAGIGLTRPMLETTDADWSLLLSVNLGGVVNGIRSFLPLLTAQGRGHISATASLSGLIGDPDLTTYNATKFGVVGMMEGLALELRRDNQEVSASVLCPGPVATDLLATSEEQLIAAGAPSTQDGERSEAVAAYLADGSHPDDVGRLAVAGIKAGRFWLLPHPEETFALLEQRAAAMRDGQLYVSDDWATEQRTGQGKS